MISLEGWTDIMYYVQDAHSFWDWVYFVLLIVVSHILFLFFFFPPLLTPSTSSRHSNRQEGGKEEEGKNDYDHVFRRIYPVEEITDGRERDGIISL